MTYSGTTNTTSRKQWLRKSKVSEAKGCSFYLRNMMNSQKSYVPSAPFCITGRELPEATVLITSRP